MTRIARCVPVDGDLRIEADIPRMLTRSEAVQCIDALTRAVEVMDRVRRRQIGESPYRAEGGKLTRIESCDRRKP